MTNRQRVEQQTSAQACAGCHAPVVNPPGFALEAYDSIGTFQDKEHDTGASIDSSADVVIGAKTVHVTGPVELMAAIASSPEAQSCYAQRWTSFAYGRELTSQDACTAQSLASKISAGQVHHRLPGHRPHPERFVPLSREGAAVKRRLFLKGSPARPWPRPSCRPCSARPPPRRPATTAASPKRLVVFYTQNGCLTNRWFPKVESGAIDAAALTGTTLEPLAPSRPTCCSRAAWRCTPRAPSTATSIRTIRAWGPS